MKRMILILGTVISIQLIQGMAQNSVFDQVEYENLHKRIGEMQLLSGDKNKFSDPSLASDVAKFLNCSGGSIYELSVLPQISYEVVQSQMKLLMQSSDFFKYSIPVHAQRIKLGIYFLQRVSILKIASGGGSSAEK